MDRDFRLNGDLEHFIGQYINMKQLDVYAQNIYGDIMQGVARMIDDFCGSDNHNKVSANLVSEIFDLLRENKVIYEALTNRIVNLAYDMNKEDDK